MKWKNGLKTCYFGRFYWVTAKGIRPVHSGDTIKEKISCSYVVSIVTKP